jgi:uncharacterized protein with PIN domain
VHPHTATFRFYAELGDFLPAARRQRDFVHAFSGTPSVKDTIEALGVPHVEVDLVVVDGRSVAFAHRLRGGERVAVYPVFEGIDIAAALHLRPAPLRETRFVLDGHLGKLARALRLLGFDTEYSRDVRDGELIARSRSEGRIILTRDRQLLKAREVTHGYWVRATDPAAQVVEVLDRFDLRGNAKPFTRCTVCNGTLVAVAPQEVEGEVPPRAWERGHEYHRCVGCRKVYWKGTHFTRLEAFVRRAIGSSGTDA